MNTKTADKLKNNITDLQRAESDALYKQANQYIK
jgi:hypothetical protein